MSIKRKIASGCFLINATYFLAVGLVFVFSKELLPFHLDVLQTSWDDLDELSQTLYLGMMRTEGAGFLATAAAIYILYAIPFKRKEFWAGSAITFIGIVEHLPTLFANIHVSQTTSATPPWAFAFGGIVILLAACFLTNQK